MISFDKNRKKVIVTMNKDFYNLDSVKKAAEAFKDAADISVSVKDKIIVSIMPDENMIDIIGYEFCNYVLSLMKNEGLV